MADARFAIVATVALQYLTVNLGLAWWRAAAIYGGIFAVFSIPGVVSLILFGVASWKLSARGHPSPRRRRAGLTAALAGYVVIVMAWDPFVWMGEDESEVLFRAPACLVPLLCLKSLVGWRAWTAVWGVVLFTSALIACLFLNAEQINCGAGFFDSWVY